MKLCLFCKQFYFYPGCSDWSDVTPGDDAEMGCNKGLIHIYLSVSSLEQYRESILKARSCEYYEQIEIEEKE